MDTSINIQLSQQQIESLRQGETICISICLEHSKRQHVPNADSSSTLSSPKEVHHVKFLPFFRQQIERLRTNGNLRTSETYRATYLKFCSFLKDRDITADDIDGAMMEGLQSFLRLQSLSMNTISFYMRILRAVYHRAVEQGLCIDCQPFTHVFTGSQATPKRALTLEELKRIKNLVLTDPDELFARNLFLFSFYTRGMSFVDLAYLKKENVHNGMMAYNRRKTGQMLVMKWEAAMQKIIDLHPSTNPYLLPIIQNEGCYERSQYRIVQGRVNRMLKLIAVKADIKQNLTMYCSRHSWATIAREAKVPMSVISHAMGHTNESTTEVYLKELDSSIIDQSNYEIISLLE